MMPKISVIVPIYNTEQYLPRCIDSIRAQTFTDFELLLIDDGSKDNSGTICDEYAAKDSRVRVFHKENGGVSSARNLGLENAQGEWIAFVDSDDWVEDDYIKCLIDKTNESFTISSYIYEKNGEVFYEKINDTLITISPETLTDILMSGILTTPYGKLYKREILERESIRFNNRLTSCEDTLFVWSYLLYVDKIRAINRFTYHYCITGNGLSNKRIDIEECVFALDCFHKLLLEYQQKYKGFDIRTRQIWLVEQMFKKAVIEEVCENKNYPQRKGKLCKLLQSESIICLLQDRTIMPKGIKRRIWDYLALKGHMLLLTLYSYFYKYD